MIVPTLLALLALMPGGEAPAEYAQPRARRTVIEGRVMRSGQGLRDVAIWVRDSRSGYDTPTAVAVTGPDGRYSVFVHEGTYYVSAHRAGHSSSPAQREVTVPATGPANFSLIEAPPTAGDGIATGRGVLIGIADYAGTSYDLSYSDDDALAFAAALTAGRNWQPENLIVILNRQATGNAIYAAVQRMATLADSDDLCLFFFSGHGGRSRGVRDVIGDAYLIETNLTDNVYDDDLGGWIAELPSTQFLGVIAACYSGGFINSSGVRAMDVAEEAETFGESFAQGLLRSIERNRRMSPTALARNGFGVVITSSRHDQPSWESHRLRHDVLVHFLLEGMEGPADTSGDGWISAQELFAYARPRVTGFHSRQTAQLYDSRPGVPLNFLDLSARIPHTLTITDGPRGEPMTVNADGVVACRVRAEDSRGGTPKYLWSADFGSFDDDRSITPNWIAPSNATGRDLSVTITLSARSSHDPAVFDEASFTVTVLPGQRGDVRITRGPAVDPAYAAPGERIACSVGVDDGVGAGLSYLWRALDASGTEVGGFDDPHSATPTWIAPAQTGDLTLAVTVTSSAGEQQHTDTRGDLVRVRPRLSKSFPPGARMVAIPGTPVGVGDPGPALGASAIASWDRHAQSYAAGTAISMAEGLGFWALFAEAAEAGVLSEAWTQDSFSWNLHAGWNIVGNPWEQPVHIGALSSDTPGSVPPLAWNYRDGGYELVADVEGLPGIGTELLPWHSYWLYAEQDCTVTLDRALVPMETSRDDGTNGWSISPVIRTASGRDGGVLLGVTDGEPLAASAPPPPIGGPQVALLGGDGRRLAVDLRADSEVRPQWEIAIGAMPGEEVTVRWPDLSEVPDDLRLCLVDRNTGTVTSMHTGASYRYISGETPRRLVMRVRPRGAMLMVSGLTAYQRDDAASVSYVLSAPATVTVEVRNMAGRRVSEVVRERSAEEGLQTLVWDFRSGAGTPIPAGRYLLQVTARSEAGESVSALAPVDVRR